MYICLSFPPFFDIMVSAPFIVNHPLSFPQPSLPLTFFISVSHNLISLPAKPLFIVIFVCCNFLVDSLVFFFKIGFIKCLLPLSLPPVFVPPYLCICLSLCFCPGLCLYLCRHLKLQIPTTRKHHTRALKRFIPCLRMRF